MCCFGADECFASSGHGRLREKPKYNFGAPVGAPKLFSKVRVLVRYKRKNPRKSSAESMEWLAGSFGHGGMSEGSGDYTVIDAV